MYPLVFIASALFGIYALLKLYKREVHSRKIIYLITAIIIGGGLSSTELLFIMRNIQVPLISYVGVSFYSSLVFYAIVKHRLMDIKIVIRKGLIYSTVIGLFTGIYVAAIFLVSQFIQNLTGQSYLLVTMFTIILTAIGFQPVKQKLQTYIDRIFFKGKYDYQKTLKELSLAAVNIIDLKQLIEYIEQKLKETINPKNLSILIYNQNDKAFETKINDYIKILSTAEIVKHFKKHKTPILFEEIENSQEALHQQMQVLQAAICIPLLSSGELFGLINLGPKLSEDMYSDEDINLLSTFAHHLAVAIENALLHEEVLETQHQLDQADKLTTLGTISAGMAHEIKNPLASIRSLTQLVKQSYLDKDSDFFDKFNEIIPRQLDRINEMVENLLHFGKPTKPRMLSMNLKAVVDEACLLLEHTCKKKRIDLVQDLPELPQIKGDPQKLGQVFTNLIINAIESMPLGGTVIIKARKDNENNNIIIELSDNGIGIPEDKISKIFDPFYTTRQQGTGLGLAVTHRIIKEHHGEISVKSQINNGTTFKIKLPTVKT